VIAALVTLDLALANPRFAPTTPSDFYRVPAAARAILDDPAGHGRVFVEDTERGTDHLSYVTSPMTAEEAARPQRERLLSYVGASAGLSLAFNVDTEAFSPMDYAKAGVLVRGAPDREMLMLLGAAGVTHVVTYRAAWDKLGPPIATLPGAFTQPLLVYRNPFALPAFVWSRS
jgi:hypothetical protein